MEYGLSIGKSVRAVEDIAFQKDLETIQKMRTNGLGIIPTDNERMLSDMIVEAYNQIKTSPELIIIAHSLPFIFCNGYDISEKLGNIKTFLLSGMPCAIMHEAVDMAKSYIENGWYKRVLVIGADKAYSDGERTFFNTIMGDCVVALLIGPDGKRNTLISSHIQTNIIAPQGELTEENKINEFRAVNASLVRDSMEQCIAKAGLTWKDIGYIVPHTSNKMFWDGLSGLLHIERSRFKDIHINVTGHFNSHDSFYHYLTLIEEQVINKNQYALLINPGFGGTQGSTLLRC